MNAKHPTQKTLAERIQWCYQFERRLFEAQFCRNNNYRLPSHWRAGGIEGAKASIWLRIARECQKNRIDPIRYVRWCLDIDTVLVAQSPEPNHLLATTNISAYLEWSRKRHYELLVCLKIQRSTSDIEHFAATDYGRVSERDAWSVTLTNPSISLSALFRYVVARRLSGPRFRELAERFYDSALLQYHMSPKQYDHVWGEECFPTSMSSDAEALYLLHLDCEANRRHL